MAITLAHAQRILQRAMEHAVEHGRSVSASVTDERGLEVAGLRMDGATWFTLGVARAKAQTAAVFGRPSDELDMLFSEHPGLVPLIDAQLPFHPTTLGGGVPVVFEGKVIGGVGLAGGLPAFDVEVAQAAASVEPAFDC